MIGGEPAIETTELTQKSHSRRLKRRFRTSMVAMLIALLAAMSATYAWYIYNTSRRTTNVRMAAGSSVNLQISNQYDTNYGSAAVLDSFTGWLAPVSTNRISGGFQKVSQFTAGGNTRQGMVASAFESSNTNDYYKTKLYLRTNGDLTDIYLSDIHADDSDENNPISTAIRVGLVVHSPGNGTAPVGEYIFAINEAKNPEAEYNTATGEEGYVLDSSRTDGTTVPFQPYTSDAYCIYNQNTGEVTLKPGSLRLCTVSGNGSGKAGTPVEIEIYIWLEGCDEDCTANLNNETLKNLAISFAGVEQK